MKKIKSAFKKLKKVWKSHPISVLVPIISFVLLIVSSLTIGIVGGIILFIALNCIYFIPCILKKKNKNKSKTTKKKRKKKIFKILLLIFLACFVLGIIAVIGFCSYIAMNAPKFDEELLYITDPTIILDKNGNEIAKLGTEKRVTLTYDELPEVLINAIIATEDSRFFEHNGVDWARFLKASALQLLGQSGAGGASTVTMQVSKNAFTSNESSGIEGIIRKFTDVYVSMFEIEKNYTKEQIMEFYINSHYLGRNAYGVEQVSLNYFGKSAKELNTAEAAMIAGLFQAPGRYDPYKNPEATEKRRQTVLKLMLRHGYIDKKEFEVAKKMTVEKLIIPKEESIYSSGEISVYQSFIDTVVDEVKEKTKKNPYTSPMIIYTTLDTNIQDYINDIMNGKTYEWENEKVQAGVAILNVKDGSIAAIGGGRNVDAIDTYNYATEIERQIGSTAKPLYDYGPGIEYNNWSSYQIFVDEPITYSDGTPINNWNGAFEGFETARIALKGSRNIPALKAFKANNKSQIIEFVTKLGLTPEIYSCDEGYTLEKKKCINNENPEEIIDAKQAKTLHEAHAIGGYDGESPLTMAAAYAAFANNGTYTEPYSFTKIIYQDTEEEFINDVKKTKAMTEETAYIISDMLATTATQAMGRYYNINGIRYAAKTGTTNYDEAKLAANNMLWSGAVNDLWTIGYNTEYAVGVWYGYDKLFTDYYNTVNNAQHTRLFQAVGKKVFTNSEFFKQPSGVVSIEVESGNPQATLPSEFTPSDLRQVELFIKGTEPTTISSRFEKLANVGNLKSKFTDDTITISWSAVKTPDINTESYLKKYFSTVFENNDYLNSFVNDRLGYNRAHIGEIGYNIYLKDSSGSLKLLDFVTTNKYEYEPEISGNYTFVVKTAYSIFKSNISEGKSTTITVEIDSPLLPSEDPKNEEIENDTTNNENEETSNTDKKDEN